MDSQCQLQREIDAVLHARVVIPAARETGRSWDRPDVEQDAWVALLKEMRRARVGTVRHAAYLVRYRLIDGLRREGPLNRGQVRDNRAAEDAGQQIPFPFPHGLGDYDVQAPGNAFDEVDAALDTASDTARVRAAVARLLSPRDGTAFLEHYLEGRTLVDIARQWQVTESRVCQVMKASTRRLRAELVIHPG